MTADHKAHAEHLLARNQYQNSAALELAQAQTHATLYLAEQQRIANLIEIARGRREEIQQLVAGELDGVSDGADGSLAELVREGCAINAQIREGLGLA